MIVSSFILYPKKILVWLSIGKADLATSFWDYNIG